MHLPAHLHAELVVVERPGELTALLELRAPATPDPTAGARPAATVQVVLDRSASMAGERLDAATRAIAALLARLGPDDRLGVVAFDDEAQVVVPCAPVGDGEAARRAVLALGPGGSTNLSAGLLRGLQEARRAAGPAGATVLLVSDGHANLGVTDADALERVAAGAHARGVTTSTIGVGLGYDERLLDVVARGGRGGHAFAEDGDQAAVAVAGEVDGLLSKAAQAVSVAVRPALAVASVHVHNDLPAHAVDRGVSVELGDLWAGEHRRLLLTLEVPPTMACGPMQVAELELRFVALPALAEQVVTLPVLAGVRPGDAVPDPRVQTELLFLRAQEAKRRAAQALAEGDVPAARGALDDARVDLAAAPPSAELAQEADVLGELSARAATDAAWVAKRSRAEHASKSRRRGR